MPPTKAPPKRGFGFSRSEVDGLLDVIEENLAISGSEWDHVCQIHEANWPNMDRTKESLKRKFAGLYGKKIPTGDPNCPPDVKKAKHIHQAMLEKIDASDGEGEGTESEDSDDPNFQLDTDNEPEAVVEQQNNEQGNNNIDQIPLARNPIALASVAHVASVGAANAIGTSGGSISAGSSNMRISHPRKKAKKKENSVDDNFNLRDYMQFMAMQRQQDREDFLAREEARERRREQEDRRMNQFMMLAMASMGGGHVPFTMFTEEIQHPQHNHTTDNTAENEGKKDDKE